MAQKQNISNITFIGMPGSGKSFIGKRLAKRLAYDFVDLDAITEKAFGLSLPQILAQIGEHAFIERQSEEACVATDGKTRAVFSPGGSIVYSESAMQRLREVSRVIFLEASLETVRARIGEAPRGIVGLGQKTLEELFGERVPLYEKWADYTVDGEQGADQIEGTILRALFGTEQVYAGVVQKGVEKARSMVSPRQISPYEDPCLSGIYAAHAEVHNQTYEAAVYADRRRNVLEAHLLDFSGDLYGTPLTIRLYKRLREDAPVTSIAVLRDLITKIYKIPEIISLRFSSMFTGIIQEKKAIDAVRTESKNRVVRIRKPAKWKLAIGQSISIDGICSTVVAIGKTYFEVVYMPETLRKTTASLFEKGREVNLERSLTLAQVIDGHLLLGHVDTTTKVVAIEIEGTSKRITIALPSAWSAYVTLHGSVAVNGISLTVAGRTKTSFTVALIPHTLSVTNLGTLAVEDQVNLEVDLVARYLLNPFAKGKALKHAKP